jgi:hypothetical protein
MSRHSTVAVLNADTPVGNAMVRDILNGPKRLFFPRVLAGVQTPRHSGELWSFGAEIFCLRPDPNEQGLIKSLLGVNSVVLVPDFSSALMVQQCLTIIRSIPKTLVKHVVLLSLNGIDEVDNPTARALKTVEKALKESGVHSWTILRKSVIQESLLLWCKDIRQHDRLRLPFGEDMKNALFAPISLDDICFFTSILLSEPTNSKVKNQTFRLTGPSLLSYYSIGQSLSKVLGRTIVYENVERSELEKYFEYIEVPYEMCDTIFNILEIVKMGKMNFISEDEKKFTGKSPKEEIDFLEMQKMRFHKV